MVSMTAPQHSSAAESRAAAKLDVRAESCSGSQATPPGDSQQELHQVLAALGDPVRLTIVRQLAERGEVPCGGFHFDLAKSTLSHHFKVLRESGVVPHAPREPR